MFGGLGRVGGSKGANLSSDKRTYLSTVSQGALIATLSKPFGTTTVFATVGTVPGQLALSGATIVAGANAALVGNTYSVKVRASSADGKREVAETLSFTATSASQVVPVALGLSASGYTENAAAGTVIATVTGGASGSTVTLVNDDGGRVALSGSNLVVGLVNTDFETHPMTTLTLRQTKAGYLDRDDVFVLAISNVFEAGTLSPLALSANSVAENTAAGFSVGTLTGRTSGSTLSLPSAAGGRFALSGTSIVTGSTSTDYETATSHSITVRETLADSANSPRDSVFTINVTNVLDGATLGPLTLSSSTLTLGSPASGAVLGATVGSSITAAGLPTGLTVDGAARTWSYSGTGSAGVANIILTETLFDSPNSPRATSIGVTIGASGRIAEITTTYGGVPADPSPAFFLAAANDAGDPNTHPAFPAFTHEAIKDGLWSDPTVWDTGTCPSTDDGVANPVVNIEDFDITYDIPAASPAANKLIWGIHGHGTGMLGFTEDFKTKLWVYWINLHGPRKYGPNGSDTEIVIWFPESPGVTTKGGVVSMGGGGWHGKPAASEVFMPTGVDLLAGTTSITHDDLAIANWKVGDKILFPATEYTGSTFSDPSYTGPASFFMQFSGGTGIEQGDPPMGFTRTFTQEWGFRISQDEPRTVTSVTNNGRTIGFAALTYDHRFTTRTLKHGQVVNIPVVVQYISYSFLIRTAGSRTGDTAIWAGADLANLQKRGHMMDMFIPVDDRYMWIDCMGRTDTNPTLVPGPGTTATLLTASGGVDIANPTNVRGRYPKHAHGMGPNRYSKRAIYKNIAITGQLGPDMSAIPIPGWGLVHHNSNVCMENCLVYNVRGGGWVSELGNEIGHSNNCMVAWARGDGFAANTYGSRAEVVGNHNGHAGVAFDCQARGIALTNNRASSCHLSWNYFAQETNLSARMPDEYSLRSYHPLTRGRGYAGGTLDGYGHEEAPIPLFDNNVSHNAEYGFFVAHRQFTDRADMTPNILRGAHAINVRNCAHIHNYAFQYFFVDSVWIGLGSGTNSYGLWRGNVSWANSISNCYLDKMQIGIANAGAGFNFNGTDCDLLFGPDVGQQGNDFTGPLGRPLADIPSRDLNGTMVDNGDGTAIFKPFVNIDSTSGATVLWPFPPASNYGYGNSEPSPGTPPPYYVLDAVNSSLDWNTLAITGYFRDELGTRNTPSAYSSESYASPGHDGAAGRGSYARNVGTTYITLEQAVRRNGCFRVSSQLKMRLWFTEASRKTGNRFTYSVDVSIPEGDLDPAIVTKYLSDPDLRRPPSTIVLEETDPRPFAVSARVPQFLNVPATYTQDATLPMKLPLLLDEPQGVPVIQSGGQGAQFEVYKENGVNYLRVASNGTFAFDLTTPANNTKTVTVKPQSFNGVLGAAKTITVSIADFIFADNFDRADLTPGTVGLGARWSGIQPGITGGKAYFTNGDEGVSYVTVPAHDNVDLSCDVTFYNGNQVGIYVGNPDSQIFILNNGGGGLWLFASGPATGFQTFANHNISAPGAGERQFRIVKQGLAVKIWCAGVLVVDENLSGDNGAITNVGIYRTGGSNNSLHRWDNFVARGA